jgi:hypothetical protein
MLESQPNRAQAGLSIVGLVVALVLLGVLAAGSILELRSIDGGGGDTAGTAAIAAATGVADRTSKSGALGVGAMPAAAACNVQITTAQSASALFYANSGGRSYPVRWANLTSSSPPLYALPRTTVINRSNPNEIDGPGWKLIMLGGGTDPPNFRCT